MITIYDNTGAKLSMLNNSSPNAVPYFNQYHRENLLTGENEMYFEVPLGVLDEGIVEGFNLVSIQDEDNNTLLFTIINTYENRDGEQPILEVTCESIAISELNDLYFGAVRAVTLQEAIDQTFGKTSYEVELPFNKTIPNSVFIVEGFITAMDMIRQIAEFFSVEYLISAKSDGYKISGRRIQFMQARGNSYRGKYFMYNRDLTGLQRTIDYTRVRNNVIPVGKPYPNGTQRNLIGYTPTNPVEGFPKPLETSYVLNLEAYQTYGQRKQLKSSLIYLPEEESLEALYLAAVEKAKEIGTPEYRYEVDVLLLENALDIEGEAVRIGDQVWFKDVSGKSVLALSARVIELTRSLTDPSLDTALFSNFAEIDASGNVNLDELKRQVAQAQSNANTAQAEASAAQAEALAAKAQAEAAELLAKEASKEVALKNRIWSGSETPDPTLVTNGDTWFRPNTPPMLDDILQYQNGAWVVTYDANEMAQIGNIADAAVEAANDAAGKANQAQADADKAIEDAGFAKVTADEAAEGVVRVEANLNGLHSVVADKADQTTVTQLSNQYNITVGEVANLQEGRNFQRDIQLDYVLYQATATKDGTNGLKLAYTPAATGIPYVFLRYLPFLNEGSNYVLRMRAKLVDDASATRMITYGIRDTGSADKTAVLNKTDFIELVVSFKYVKGTNAPRIVFAFNANTPRTPFSILVQDVSVTEGAVVPKAWYKSFLDYADQAQITVLNNNINLRVTQSQVDASILADNTLKDTRTTNQNPEWYLANYPKQAIRELKTRTVIGITVGAETLGALETDIPWTSLAGGQITQTFSNGDGVFQRKSVSSTAWSAWGQIADSTNIVSQINISPESILIQSKRIHLAGDTTIDNAVIKSAMIDSMTASKLTAGTIDANVINVKNINADEINAGTLRGREVINTFDSMFQGARLVGETSLKDSQISIDWTSVTYPEQSGYFNINPLSIGGGYKENNVTKTWWELNTNALTLSNDGKTATLSAERLYDSGWINVPRNPDTVFRNWSNPTTDYGADYWDTKVRKRLGNTTFSFFMRAGAVRGPGNNPVNSAVTIGTIPENFRPDIDFSVIAGTNTLNATGTVRVNSNGKIQLYRTDAIGTQSISFVSIYFDTSV